MSLISFGICSNRLLDIIITCILLALRNQIQKRNDKDKMKNIYFNFFLICVGQICSIFLYIAQKYLSKSVSIKKKNSEKNNEDIKITRFDATKLLTHKINNEIKFFPSNNRKQYCLLIFLSSILGLLTCLFLYSIKASIGEIPIIFILTTLILSNIVFKDIYSKHHYISLIIIFLSCIVHVLNDIKFEKLNLEKSNSKLYHFTVFFFIFFIYGI